jgi:acetoin utilization protein AcuB
MIKHPPMVEPDMPIVKAQRYMSENDIRHLPVVGDGKRLKGLLTRQRMLIDPRRLGSLDVWEITRQISDLRVKDVMIKVRDVITIDPDTPFEQAASVMVEKQVGCLPVVADKIVVGLITERDLLAHLTEMMAMQVPGVRVTVRMPLVSDRGELAQLIALIAERGWCIEALGGATSPIDPAKWDMVVKLRASKDDVVAALETIEGQEIIDVREA